MIPNHLLPDGYDSMTTAEKITALELQAERRDTWAEQDAQNWNSHMAECNRKWAKAYRELAAELKGKS